MTQTVEDVLTDLSIRSQAFVDGAYVDAESGEAFDCVNPATGRTIAAVAACDAGDVDRAVRGARAAFESGVWSRTAPKKRKRVLIRFAELIREHRDELALLETLDMGKPIKIVDLARQMIAVYQDPELRARRALKAKDEYAPIRWDVMKDRYLRLVDAIVDPAPALAPRWTTESL